MRPVKTTAAHHTDRLAELVCSNSFKIGGTQQRPRAAQGRDAAAGERRAGCGRQARVPGGAALAVDRLAFAQGVHDRVTAHPAINLVRGEVTELESPGIVATGPLTSEALAAAIARKLDASSLAFFDAIAPIVSADSLDTSQLFRASRYGKGAGVTTTGTPRSRKRSTDALVTALRTGEQYQPHHEFDRTPYFEAACRWRRWPRADATCCASGR